MGTSIESYSSVFRASRTLCLPITDSTKLLAARNNVELNLGLPVNSELAILPDFMEVLDKNSINFKPSPYWKKEERYDPLDVFISTIQFFDRHNEPLPYTTVPPEDDVKKFVDIVLKSEHRLTLSEQFKHLLVISNGNVLGAANVGFLASRLLARGWDTRAYPNIPISTETIIEANKHFAQFESDSKTNDASGDTYYFWTHFFATSVYSQLGCFNSKILNKFFEFGTPTMKFVRKYFAGQPIVTEHFEASLLGRHVGIAISELYTHKDI